VPAVRRILAAVDFSPWTPDVVATAAGLAQACGAQVELLHVLPLRETDASAAEAQLALCVPPAAAATVVARRVTRALTPDLGLLEALRESPADVVVIGTHGRTGLQHIRLGSVAERIIELSPAPVLVVRRSVAERQGGAMIKITKILCPVDFSAHSQAALEHAAELARRYGASLLLLHVVEPILYPVAYGLPPVAPIDYEQVAREAAARTLAGYASKLGALEVRQRVEAGAASQRICELAKEQGSDLIVLATHGYTGLKHVLLGSTAERVVRHAPCAVLVVKTGGAG